MKLALNTIIIGERQRIELGDLEDLDSMTDPEVGQICPIVVHKTLLGYELVDGRRRLEKATRLGWKEVEVLERDQLTPVQKQKIELLADIGRKERSWQEICLSVAKIHRIMERERERDGGSEWTIRQMASFTGFPKSNIGYMLQVAEGLVVVPRDEGLWACNNYVSAMVLINERNFKDVHAELERRREAVRDLIPAVPPAPTMLVFRERVPGSGMQEPVYVDRTTGVEVASPSSPVQPPDTTAPEPMLTLQRRAELYNEEYAHLGPPNTPLFYINKNEREFIHALWVIGGGNVSDFYGSYQIEYLKRIACLFPDCKGAHEVLHLFSGSLPPSDEYSRVGQDPTGQYKSDIECDAHQLSTFLPFHPKLIYADPPYSKEDSEHYENAMVNRAAIVQQCGLVLRPGGYLVWMDQAWPVFSNETFQFVGCIGYIRSTGNRFRMVSIFRKHATPPISEYD